MKHVAIAAVLVGGCSVEIDGYFDENVRDHDISFRYTTPIATGQVGRNWVFDGCTDGESNCTEQEVGVMNVAVDKPDVLKTTAGTKTWDGTALAAGSTTVSVMADNEGALRRGMQVVEVLDATKVELVPAGVLARAKAPMLVHVPRTCATPFRMTTLGLATFAYKLMAGERVLKGSGFYPFASVELTAIEPFDRGSDGGGIQFIAGAVPATSTIASMVPSAMAPMPIEIIEGASVTAITLSEQELAPTPDQERLIWAEVIDTGLPVCFDNNTRTITSTTPTICTVSDTRRPAQQYKGPGPYILNWHGSGTCTVTVTVNGSITATKDYAPI
jgi:hypothetical protein